MIKITDIKPNKKNPRTIDDVNLDKLKNSIQQFPQMMALRPMVVNKRGIIIGGNMRYRALVELGFKELPDEWVKTAEELSPDDEKRFIVEDNIAFGEWDMTALAKEWDANILAEWGLDVIKPFEGDIDSFFEESDKQAKQKELLCPHCGGNVYAAE